MLRQYKHVPIVEINKFAGLMNNTIGTLVIAQAAINTGVKKFILISSDKAVRPTNVMGASKKNCRNGIKSFVIKTTYN